jgi:RHS repeat-associated protein
VVSFVRSDHIGRPVFATNAAGTKVWTASYLPFGGVRTTTGTPITARFPGQWFQSESGLHQNWMRDYDPTTGRYIEADPLGLVDGASVYGYVGGNPMRWIDPWGLQALCPSSPPTNDPNWKPYRGDPGWFHCGFDGYLENRDPTPDDPIAECFYDNGGCLVDDNHEYSWCQGTADQYTVDDPFSHTVLDSGGIRAHGLTAFLDSYRHALSPIPGSDCQCRRSPIE